MDAVNKDARALESESVAAARLHASEREGTPPAPCAARCLISASALDGHSFMLASSALPLASPPPNFPFAARARAGVRSVARQGDAAALLDAIQSLRPGEEGRANERTSERASERARL
jgi:hypothetical protein